MEALTRYLLTHSSYNMSLYSLSTECAPPGFSVIEYLNIMKSFVIVSNLTYWNSVYTKTQTYWYSNIKTNIINRLLWQNNSFIEKIFTLLIRAKRPRWVWHRLCSSCTPIPEIFWGLVLVLQEKQQQEKRGERREELVELQPWNEQKDDYEDDTQVDHFYWLFKRLYLDLSICCLRLIFK